MLKSRTSWTHATRNLGAVLKVWRNAFIGLVGLLVVALALLWFMPAAWAMPWLSARLNGVQLKDVSGSLWDGNAARVLNMRGENLGALHWQLSRWALLGDNRLQLALHGPRVDFSGRMTGSNAADATWTDVQMRVDLSLFVTGPLLLGGLPRGTLHASAGHVQLHGGWPLTLDAQLQWQDAALQMPGQDALRLGGLRADIQAVNGVIEGHVVDDGHGPLRVDGRLQLSPLARRFMAATAPRGVNPLLSRWLAGFGAVDADGVTHINYSGGLAAAAHGNKQ